MCIDVVDSAVLTIPCSSRPQKLLEIDCILYCFILSFVLFYPLFWRARLRQCWKQRLPVISRPFTLKGTKQTGLDRGGHRTPQHAGEACSEKTGALAAPCRHCGLRVRRDRRPPAGWSGCMKSRSPVLAHVEQKAGDAFSPWQWIWSFS